MSIAKSEMSKRIIITMRGLWNWNL